MRVYYEKRFEKELKALPPKIKGQFYRRLEIFLKDKDDKILNNHGVGINFPNCRSINITGNYRAIFEDQGDTVTFIALGSHADLYE